MKHLAIRTKPSQASRIAETKAENLVKPPKLDGSKKKSRIGYSLSPSNIRRKEKQSKFSYVNIIA